MTIVILTNGTLVLVIGYSNETYDIITAPKERWLGKSIFPISNGLARMGYRVEYIMK